MLSFTLTFVTKEQFSLNDCFYIYTEGKKEYSRGRIKVMVKVLETQVIKFLELTVDLKFIQKNSFIDLEETSDKGLNL